MSIIINELAKNIWKEFNTKTIHNLYLKTDLPTRRCILAVSENVSKVLQFRSTWVYFQIGQKIWILQLVKQRY